MFDLRGINARHRRLVGLRLWLRTEGDEVFRRLFGAQVYVSYDSEIAGLQDNGP